MIAHHDDCLHCAWQRAVDALPEGYAISIRHRPSDGLTFIDAYHHDGRRRVFRSGGPGDTLQAALHALADRLTQRSEGTEGGGR